MKKIRGYDGWGYPCILTVSHSLCGCSFDAEKVGVSLLFYEFTPAEFISYLCKVDFTSKLPGQFCLTLPKLKHFVLKTNIFSCLTKDNEVVFTVDIQGQIKPLLYIQRDVLLNLLKNSEIGGEK